MKPRSDPEDAHQDSTTVGDVDATAADVQTNFDNNQAPSDTSPANVDQSSVDNDRGPESEALPDNGGVPEISVDQSSETLPNNHTEPESAVGESGEGKSNDSGIRTLEDATHTADTLVSEPAPTSNED